MSFKYPGGDRVIKVRRPKHPRIIDTALRRGHRNNGLIEIENDLTEEEEEDQPQSYTVPRISELQIKLDFIDRAKRYLFLSYDLLPYLLIVYTERGNNVQHMIDSTSVSLSMQQRCSLRPHSNIALNLLTPLLHLML